MKNTPLYDKHQDLKGRIVDFAGYNLPVSYTSIKEEYFAVREKTGIFDISHMAPFFFEGDTQYLLNFLDYITIRKISNMINGEVKYNAIVNENGLLIDDITVYKINNEKYMLVVNASNQTKANDFFKKVISANENFEKAIQFYRPEDYVFIALQGPTSEKILKNLSDVLKLQYKEIFYYEFYSIEKENFTSVVSRTGYTGEDGFELLLPVEVGQKFFSMAIEEGALPCGLASRDLLRMEVFYPLYGHELKENFTPSQGGLKWLIDKDKDFIGKEAVLKELENPSARIMGFVLEEDGVPRTDYEIFVDKDGEKEKIGVVTSGGFSFTWNKGFGLVYIDQKYAKKGQNYLLKIRDKYKKITMYFKSPYQGSIVRR